MTKICHLFDGRTGWEQRVGVSFLVDRFPSDRYEHRLVAITPQAQAELEPLHRPIDRIRAYGSLAMTRAPGVARLFAGQRVDMVHAWGVRAAVTARTASNRALIVHLFDPATAAEDAKRLRSLATPTGFAVACSCQIVRRRLVEAGLDPALTVVIRPGVDLQLINRCKRSAIRASLGLTDDHFLILLPGPIRPGGGQGEAFQAIAMLGTISDEYRVLIPGPSFEQRRIVRACAPIPSDTGVVVPRDRHPFEQLVAIADALLITPRGDIATTSIAWAMAARTAVIGTAVHAVAEMISHKVNGLLFKQVTGRCMAAPILACLGDRASQAAAKEVAQGQAYEVFSVRRYVEQCMRLSENVLHGKAPGDGIQDSAKM